MVPLAIAALGACSQLIGEGDYHLRVDPETGSDAGGSAIPLAKTNGVPSVVAIDTHTVYWIREASDGVRGAVLSVPREGGSVSVVVDGLTKPSGLRVDSDYIYYSNDRADPGDPTVGLYRLAKTGGRPTLVDRDDNGFGWLSIHGAYLFTEGALSGGGAVLRRSDKLGAPPQVSCIVANATGRIPVMSAGTNGVFFFDSGRGAIMATLGDCGSTETTFADGQNDVRVTALDNGFLYWTNGISVYRQPTTRPGVPAEHVLASQVGAYGIDSGNSGVYFTCDAVGTVRQITGDLGTRTVAAHQAEPGWIVVGSDAVFWANRGTGDIMKLPL